MEIDNNKWAIESISNQNLENLTQMMLKLWPECDFEVEFSNAKRILSSDRETCFLAKDKDLYIGFIYLSMRNEYIEGVSSFPVAYIEGIYVDPEYRRSGLGKVLVEVGEKWGKEKGCKQYASDTELENEGSVRFHREVGFEVSKPVIFFVKAIS